MSGNLEEQVEAVMRQMQQSSWTTMVKKILEEVESDNLEGCKGNKLCKAKILSHLIMALGHSLKGWTQWLNFDSMDNLTDEELDDTYTKLRKLIVEFLKLDIEITEKKEKEKIEKKRKELLTHIIKRSEDEEKRRKTSGAPPHFYVS